MYGTVARTRVRPENRERLREVFERQAYQTVPGFMTSYILWQDDTDAAWLFAIFQDRETYEANAGDPAQHERYLEYRALLEEEPEWHDGEIDQATAR
jgi:quinol monooxygenase YgiN